MSSGAGSHQPLSDSEYALSDSSRNPSPEPPKFEGQTEQSTTPIGLVVRQQRLDEFLIQLGYCPGDLNSDFVKCENCLESANWDIDTALASWKSETISGTSDRQSQAKSTDHEDEDEQDTGQPTKSRMSHLLKDFKSVVDQKVTDQVETRRYLQQYDWNATKAAMNWQIDRAKTIRAQTAAQADPTDLTDPASTSTRKLRSSTSISQPLHDDGSNDSNQNPGLAQSRIPYNKILEQERRDSAVMFHLLLKKDLNISISCSVSVLLLHLANWDIEVALQNFGDLDKALERLSEAFDHMRNSDPDMVEKDERLATLLTITQRVDVLSILQHLESCRWDLVDSLVVWFNTGIPISKKKMALNPKWRRKDHDGQARPMPNSTEVIPSNKQTVVSWAPEAQEFVEGGTLLKPIRSTASKNEPGRKPGFALDDDRQTLQKGIPTPAKFIHEYIQNGKLKKNIFKPKKFKWLPDSFYPENAPTGNLPRFDWNNAGDIEIANSWRRQVFARTTQSFVRPASQPFTPEMNQFLYDLSEQYCQLLMKEKNRERSEVIPFGIPKDIKIQWHKDFNDKFVGTTPAGYQEPVKPRSSGALMTQRSRIEAICNDFGVAPSMTKDAGQSHQDWARRQADETDRCKQAGEKRKRDWCDSEDEDDDS